MPCFDDVFIILEGSCEEWQQLSKWCTFFQGKKHAISQMQ